MTVIGTCSICGGDVVAHDGAWYGVCPPPPPQCQRCGARPKAPMIEMDRRTAWQIQRTVPLITRVDWSMGDL